MKTTALILISFALLGCVSVPVDEEKLAVSREFVDVMMEIPEIQQTFEGLKPSMMETVLEKHPSLTDTQQQKVAQLLSTELDREIPALTEYIAQLYAEFFYKNELEQLAVIMKDYHEGYVLPPDQLRLAEKLASKLPVINRKMQGFGKSLGEDIGDRLFEKLDQDGEI